jgi:hypothetical protein
MARRRKLVHVRGPRVRVTPGGKVRLSKPSMRVGGWRCEVRRGARASLRSMT